jgi:hypothetical protein
MSENQVRPPENPKPSSNAAVNHLKNRLILGWSQLPSSGIGPALPVVRQPGTVVQGYGEDQFDVADNFDANRSSVIGMESSMWSEHNPSKYLERGGFAPSLGPITSNNKRNQEEDFASTYDEKLSTTNLQGSRAAQSKHPKLLSASNLYDPSYQRSVPHNEDHVQGKTKRQHSNGSRNKHRRHTQGQASTSLMSHNAPPHLSMSQVYQDGGGWGEVADSIAYGDAEFCYLQGDASDRYKFSLKDTCPNASILKNDYITMSKYGIMRSSIVTGQSEMVSYEAMAIEQKVYHQLLQINVFRQFRMWKQFYVWRRTVRYDKFWRMVMFVKVFCCI